MSSRGVARAALALLALLWAAPRASGLDWTWTRKDTALELTYVGVQAVDWMQTRRFLAAGREEMNPLLGSRPARGQLVAYNLVTMAAHAAIARALPHPLREVWQLSWIGVEGAQVGSNWRTAGGLRLQLP